MKIFVETSKKLLKCSLSKKVEDSFIFSFTSNRIEKRISLSYENNEWNILATTDYSIYNAGAVVNDFPLTINSILALKFLDETVLLYRLNDFDEDYSDVSINNQNIISIGNGQNSSIVVSTIEGELVIKNENNIYTLIDEKGFSFLNNRRQNNAVLKIGDIIFIKGTKLIFMGSYLRVCGIKPLKINLPKHVSTLVDASKYTPANELEKNVQLYNEDSLFFHTPQLKFNIKNETVNIDSPPEPEKNEGLPIIFTLGTSLVMALTSIMTISSRIGSIKNGTSTLKDSIFTIIIPIATLITSVFLPILSKRYQKSMKKKKEKLRQKKYAEYLNLKRTEIQNIINEHSKILKDNFLDSNLLIDNIRSHNRKIWHREIIDNDFLTIKLGIGNRHADIAVKAPEKHFTLYDDNLKDEAISIASKPIMMKDVPITASLIENNVFPIILECTNKVDYVNSILLQLIATHSPTDLKLVFFLTEENADNFSYVKYLFHTLSNDKTTRFFATTEEEIKVISTFLENEYATRKSTKSSDDTNEAENKQDMYKNYEPYYLIITDNFKAAKYSSIVNTILETKSNYGFSLLMLESNMKNLPSKCEKFARIVDLNSGLFGKDLSSKDQATYNVEYVDTNTMNEMVSIISNIPISSASIESTLPQTLEFLEMCEVGKIEQLNILNRWEVNNPTNSLATQIGVHKSGAKFELDLHEKFHGPHGLIAGMTGSGKSEFIITYILSMAINYHPDEVQFVLIDYKGGGLAGAFVNSETNVALPHVIGTITNLDVSEMNRTLVSIESELKRRQRIFNEVREKLGESTIDIYKYQRLYREGAISEPMSHLFIISDEFAELKSQQPEFMDELISTARIGRSLGVHLILATQKPSGVVNDQIWSNSRFRICLKVQSPGDSNEMLKRKDAAFIKETGRFYLQVGHDELFEMGQSGWAGAKYQPSDRVIKKINDSLDFINNIGYINKSANDIIQKDTTNNYGDQLTNIVKHIYNLAVKENLKFHKLWLPKIPDFILLNDLITKYQYTKEEYDVVGIIGEYDNPAEQMQGLLKINFSKTGNTAIMGIPGSGKENLLITLIYSLCLYYTPNEVNIYILDFGTESLKNFEKTPHIGDVVTAQNADKIPNLLKYLNKEIEKRRQLFSEYNGNINDYNRLNNKKVPLIMIFINSFEALLENSSSDLYGQLVYFFREGTKYGIIFTLTTSSTSTLRNSVLQYFSNLIGMQFSDPYDYRYRLGAPSRLTPAKIFGRGLTKVNEKTFEFQTAYINQKDNINDQIKAIKEHLNEKYPNISARRIPQIPTSITTASILPYTEKIEALPIGVDSNEFVIYYHDFTRQNVNTIMGNSALSKLMFICGLIDEINSLEGNHIEVYDSTKCIKLNKDEGNIYNSNANESLNSIVQNISTSQNNNFIFIVGIKNFYDELNDENKTKFNNLVSAIKNKKIYLILIDNYNSFKKLTLEKWYIDYVDNTNGLWLGNGINTQVLYNLNNLKSEDTNEDFAGLIYAIKDGEYCVIKGIGE